jgi:hypothetical protein
MTVAVSPGAGDTAFARGEVWGPLHRLPTTAKESCDVAHRPTARGFESLRDNVATANAVSVQRLLDAGAVIVGKTSVSAALAEPEPIRALRSVRLFGSGDAGLPARSAQLAVRAQGPGQRPRAAEHCVAVLGRMHQPVRPARHPGAAARLAICPAQFDSSRFTSSALVAAPYLRISRAR